VGVPLAVLGVLALLPVGLFAPSAGAARATQRAQASAADHAQALPPVSEQVPPTDCSAPVGYNQNTTLPGYLVPDGQLGTTCVPFSQVQLPPAGYKGDYLVQQFSDARARHLLAQCEAHPPCAAVTYAKDYQPAQFRATGTIVPFGKIDPNAANVNLRDIRRPAFFGRAPYDEPIANADSRTYTFEFTVPPDPYEVLKGITAPVKLRGWYIKGVGVPDQHGHRIRALAIIVGGRSIETTAVQDPRDPLYTRSASTRKYVPVTYPSRGTEKWGVRQWRETLYKLNLAGFDVLTYDKRGHGMSGDITADDTLQQGLDMLRAIRALDTGDGVRTLGPGGAVRSGRAAVRALLLPGEVLRMPILLGGPSQGSFATDWAMNANFNRWCELDLPGTPCHQPWGYRNIVGALTLANFPVWTFSDTSLEDEAALREIDHVAFLPTSEPLANIASWPAAFFAKGVWDEYQGPWPTFNEYLRVRGPKELFFYRGPHSENEGGPANVALEQDRMTQFAVGVVLHRPTGQPLFANLKQAIAASPPIWEYSTQPTFPSSQ
jgi:pimeloyl-ACP methyl ester carboxylesterase